MNKNINWDNYWSPAFDTMFEFVFIIDNDFNIVRVNKTFLEFTKKNDPDFFIGKKCYEVMHASDGPIVECPHSRTVKGGKTETSEFYEEGLKKWLIVKTTPILNNDKELIGSIHIAEDITGRKKSEMLTQQLLKEQRIILDSAPAWIFYKDKENRFIRVNKAYADATGMSKEALEGKSVYDIYNKEQADAYWRDDKEVMASGAPKMGIIETAVTKNGIMWVRTDKIPYRDEQGNIIGIIGFSIDITEQVRAAQAIKDSEEKFRTIYEYSTDAIMVLKSPEWKFIEGNPSAIKIFNLTDRAQFVSLGPWDLSPEYQPDGSLSKDKAREMIDKAMKEGQNHFEWTHKRYNGDNFPAIVSLVRIKLGGKELLQAIVKDITKQREAESELNKRIRQLEVFNKAAVDRELRIIELKKKVAELEKSKNI